MIHRTLRQKCVLKAVVNYLQGPGALPEFKGIITTIAEARVVDKTIIEMKAMFLSEIRLQLEDNGDLKAQAIVERSDDANQLHILVFYHRILPLLLISIRIILFP